jgi:hypothetical protein
MKQEAKGKIFVGMIVSIVAFGFATGTGFFLGANPLSTQGVLNLTQQSQFPALPASTPSNNTVQNANQPNTSQSSSSSDSNVVTPTNPNTSTNSSSNSNGNTNKSSNSTG